MWSEGAHLEPALERPFVQPLDALEDVLELEWARVDAAGGQSPKHESVVRVWAMSKTNPQGAAG